MPLTTSLLPTELSISVVDYNREVAGTSIFLPTTFAIGDVVTNTAAFEAILAAMTDGFIKSGGVSRRLNQTDDPPVSGGPITSNVQRKGVFVFENSFGTYNTYQIPSIDRALVLPGSKDIDLANAAVVAYVAMMTGGLGGVTGSRPVGGNGYNLVRLAAAYEDTSD